MSQQRKRWPKSYSVHGTCCYFGESTKFSVDRRLELNSYCQRKRKRKKNPNPCISTHLCCPPSVGLGLTAFSCWNAALWPTNTSPSSLLRKTSACICCDIRDRQHLHPHEINQQKPENSGEHATTTIKETLERKSPPDTAQRVPSRRQQRKAGACKKKKSRNSKSPSNYNTPSSIIPFLFR